MSTDTFTVYSYLVTLNLRGSLIYITQTCLCNMQRLFLVVKIKFLDAKNMIFFLNLAQNINFGYMLEPPRLGGSNEYPQSMF